MSLQDETTEFLLYTAPSGEVKVEVLLNNETLWLTQARIAELFGVQRPAITKHLSNIFERGELQEPVVCSILEHTTEHGALAGKTQTSPQIRPVKHSNLDAIISKVVLDAVINLRWKAMGRCRAIEPNKRPLPNMRPLHESSFAFMRR